MTHWRTRDLPALACAPALWTAKAPIFHSRHTTYYLRTNTRTLAARLALVLRCLVPRPAIVVARLASCAPGGGGCVRKSLIYINDSEGATRSAVLPLERPSARCFVFVLAGDSARLPPPSHSLSRSTPVPSPCASALRHVRLPTRDELLEGDALMREHWSCCCCCWS